MQAALLVGCLTAKLSKIETQLLCIPCHVLYVENASFCVAVSI